MLDLTHTIAEKYLRSFNYYFEIFKGLGGYISSTGRALGHEYALVSPSVWVHESAVVSPWAYLGENVIVGAGSVVRQGAFIRGNAVVGENCVVGNSSEIKNSVLFDGVQTPHFNYVGDSILGYKSHMGAGAVTSNVKSDKSPITAHICGVNVVTGLKKLGAVLGDYAEIGCNCVLNPAAVVGARSSVYPLSSVRGEVPPDSIYKSAQNIVKRM